MYRYDFDELEDMLDKFYTGFGRYKSTMLEIGAMYRNEIRERIIKIYGSLNDARRGLEWVVNDAVVINVSFSPSYNGAIAIEYRTPSREFPGDNCLLYSVLVSRVFSLTDRIKMADIWEEEERTLVKRFETARTEIKQEIHMIELRLAELNQNLSRLGE